MPDANDEKQLRNRKERRAAARESGSAISPPSSTPRIKLAQPDRSGPKGKTLLDLYEEKKSLLEHGQPFSRSPSDRVEHDISRKSAKTTTSINITTETSTDTTIESLEQTDDDTSIDEPIGPLGRAVFAGISLTMLHFTLDVLVHQQYRQEISWSEIVSHTLTALPIFCSLHYLVHAFSFTRLLLAVKAEKKYAEMAVQGAWFTVAVVTGSCTIHLANRYDYYAVMKRAPPLGTLWVWSVVEMNVVWGALSVLVNVVYLFVMGYSVV